MRPRTAFTLTESLIVIAIIALLAGILMPALFSARMQSHVVKGGANLQQISQASLLYLDDHDRNLPQLKVQPNGTVGDSFNAVLFPWLYGGRRAAARPYRVSAIGADQRPLNAYLGDYSADDDVEVFKDPLDTGTQRAAMLSLAHRDDDVGRSSMYRLVGTSYLLNDHALDQIPCPFVEIFPTLIPTKGGRMPQVDTTSRTWLVGQAPIYNYDDNEDAKMTWHGPQVRASLAFVDGHVELAVPVKRGVTNTTPDYTFLPTPNWANRFEHIVPQ